MYEILGNLLPQMVFEEEAILALGLSSEINKIRDSYESYAEEDGGYPIPSHEQVFTASDEAMKMPDFYMDPEDDSKHDVNGMLDTAKAYAEWIKNLCKTIEARLNIENK